MKKFKGSWLELGCGNGNVVRQVLNHENDIDIIAIDKDEVMLAEARIFTDATRYPRIKFLCHDFISWTYPQENFDVISCVGNTLTSVLNSGERKSLLKNVYLSLKKGGVFILSIANDLILDGFEAKQSFEGGDDVVSYISRVKENRSLKLRTYQFYITFGHINEHIVFETAIISATEMISDILEAGFSLISISGDRIGSVPYSIDSKLQTYVLTKESCVGV